jgi:hypothetical protein
MERERADGEHGIPVRPAGERLEHEGTLIDQRPREKRRDATFFALVGLGMVLGAVVGLLGVWVLAEIVGKHYSPFVYVVVAVIGAGVAPAITPYLSLARSDGADATTVKSRGRRGQADTPIEGAEAVDQPQAAIPGRNRDARDA